MLQVGQDGGEDLLASWPDSVEPFNSVTLTLLQHLDKEGLSPQQALQLSGAAFIPVAHASRLVAPQQLFLRLGGAALAPFAWEVPGQFVAQAVLLKSLGVRDEPGAEDLVRDYLGLRGTSLGLCCAGSLQQTWVPRKANTPGLECYCRVLTCSRVSKCAEVCGVLMVCLYLLLMCRCMRCGALLGSCRAAA